MVANIDSIKDQIRKRHGLKDDAAVGIANLPATVTVDEDGDPFLFTARISNLKLDRDREVLLPMGVRTDEFNKSGAVFWNHDYDRPVAASVGKIGRSNEAVTGKARFMKREDGMQGEFLPDYARSFVRAMAESGKSAGVSVGFEPLEWRDPTKKDIEDFGEDVERVFTEWNLLEWSIAPVQANPDAFVTAIGKSMDDVGVKALCKRVWPEYNVKPKKAVMPTVLVELPAKTVTKPKPRKVMVVLPAKQPKIKKKPLDVEGELAKAMGFEEGKLWV